MAKQKDLFVNAAAINVTMSAADTLTFNQFESSVQLFEKVAWVVHRIEYSVDTGTIGAMTATTDWVWVGITSSNTITDMHSNTRGVLDQFRWYRFDAGTAANYCVFEHPVIHDFSSLPGGGLIVPPEPLFAGMDTQGLGAAGVCRVRVYFTHKVLPAADYWELIEATRLIV